VELGGGLNWAWVALRGEDLRGGCCGGSGRMEGKVVLVGVVIDASGFRVSLWINDGCVDCAGAAGILPAFGGSVVDDSICSVSLWMRMNDGRFGRFGLNDTLPALDSCRREDRSRRGGGRGIALLIMDSPGIPVLSRCASGSYSNDILRLDGVGGTVADFTEATRCVNTGSSALISLSSCVSMGSLMMTRRGCHLSYAANFR
jgi:hypothetical protein